MPCSTSAAAQAACFTTPTTSVIPVAWWGSTRTGPCWPAPGAVPDVEWVCGVAADAAWTAEFDLATMTSNAFQCLVTDDEARLSSAAIRTCLRDGGRFLFGTRH